MAKTKKIKVAYSNRMDAVHPMIRMEGKWLEELGFSIGTRLMVEYGEGSIRIRPFTDEENRMEDERLHRIEIEKARRDYEKLLDSIRQRTDVLPKVAERGFSYGSSLMSHLHG